LDNVFAAFPQTDKVQALKRDMLAGMEEKYLTLRQSGNSEHEAVGIVIANFGSIDEIRMELGIARAQQPESGTTATTVQSSGSALAYDTQQSTTPNVKGNGTTIPLTLHEAKGYISQARGVGYALGLAFILIALGILLPILMTNVNVNITTGLVTTGGALAVVTLIITAHAFAPYQTANILLDANDHMEIAGRYARFVKRSIYICAVVGAAILILALMEATLMPLLGVAICIAAFLFPVFVASKSAYDYILGKWQYKSGRWMYLSR